MYGKYFEYDGKDSQTFNLTIAGLEQGDDVTFGLNREVLHSSLNRYRNRVGHMGTRWNDVLAFNIQFIKDPCDFNTQSKMIFSEDEVNEINAWLTSPDYPKLLHMYDYDFERDSSDSMILIDMTTDASITVNASGYNAATYSMSGTTLTGVVDVQDVTLATPPISGTVNRYNGYYALVINDKDFMKSITSLSVGNTEYQNVRTNFWLGTYAKNGGKIVNSYTVLVDTEKVLNCKYDYFGVFSDVQPQIIDGEVVGFTAIFQTNSPFAWTHEITQTVTNGSVTFTVNNAERYREIYPTITITATADDTPSIRSEITIGNSVDGLSMTLSLRQGDATTIDAMRSVIKDNSGLISFTDLGISDVDYIYWPRLYNGENTITITGDCTATIKYREPRKVGDY